MKAVARSELAHKSEVNCVRKISESQVVTTSDDKTVKVWDIVFPA
jgi:hypothetical protein